MIPINKTIKKLIEENAVAVSTVGIDGNPHCIAVAYVKVVSDNQILITDNYMVTTLENLKSNKNVAIAVWNKDWKKECIGYELKGVAEYFIEGTWHDKVKQIPENEDESCKGAILVTVNNIKRLA